MYGYDHLSEAVPVPGTGRIYMIHAVSGKWRVKERLLELDMDTGRCRIADLPGMGEGLKLRWFTEDWLLVQGNGEILSDDFAQLINMSTREVLRIRPGMFGGEKMQHIGVLTDGTVVIVTQRNGVGPVFRYPPTSGVSCGRRTSPARRGALAGVSRNLSESALLPPREGIQIATEVCRQPAGHGKNAASSPV